MEVPAAVMLRKYIQTMLFGVQRPDVAAFAGMSAVMRAVPLLASYVPARRARAWIPRLRCGTTDRGTTTSAV